MVRVTPCPRSVAVWVTGTSRQGRASRAPNRPGWFSLTGRTKSAPRWCRWSAVARWQCRASAVMTAPARSRSCNSGMIIGISFVFRADLGLRRDHSPSPASGHQQVNLAAVGAPGSPDGLAVHPDLDQRLLLAGQIATGPRWRGQPAVRAGTVIAGRRCAGHQPGANPHPPRARRLQLPRARSWGGPAGARAAPPRLYNSASRPAGTSAAQPAIAVNDRIPAATAAAASASTTAFG